MNEQEKQLCIKFEKETTNIMETLKCEICEACFKSEMALTGHKISVHGSREDSHPCKLCPASFSEQSSLTSHISSVHLKPKPFSCLKCSESFLTIEGMTVYIIFHQEQYRLEETVHEVKHPLLFNWKKNDPKVLPIKSVSGAPRTYTLNRGQ